MEQAQNPNSYFQKSPPNDIEAEQAVLSCIFIDNEAGAAAVERLSSDDFYRPENKIIFEACQELYKLGMPVDVITIKNKLEEKNVFEQVGGLSYIASIAAASGNSVNVKYYAKIVEEKPC